MEGGWLNALTPLFCIMFTSVGTLRYSASGSTERWLVLDVDGELARYYRSLIPTSMKVQKPRYPPHCTIVRAGKEAPIHLDAWGKHKGEVIEFFYDPYVHYSGVYYWLNVWSPRFVEIRTELGMPPKSRWTLPPSGGFQCFHVTVGNSKLL